MRILRIRRGGGKCHELAGYWPALLTPCLWDPNLVNPYFSKFILIELILLQLLLLRFYCQFYLALMAY